MDLIDLQINASRKLPPPRHAIVPDDLNEINEFAPLPQQSNCKHGSKT